MTSPRPYLVAAALVSLLFFSAARGQTTTHSSTAAIGIPGAGAATPYPSVIVVSGATTSISSITVRLNGFTHSFPDDVQVLLVAPTGQRTVLMGGAGSGFDVSAVGLVFAQDSANILPSDTQLLPGTYRPNNYTTGSLPAPAPAGPYTADLSVFNGLNANGNWSLFVNDTTAGDSGSIAGGWSITFNDTLRQPQSVATAFTYQGRLQGLPAGSTLSLRFALWDSPDSTNTANRVSSVITREVTLDANNLFTTSLDFGASIQRQRALYLQIETVTNAGGLFTTLSPRQPITGVPLALQLKGVTVNNADQVGVGGINDPQFALESAGRIRIRGDAGVAANSPGIWFSSPSPAGTLVNRSFVGQYNDSSVGFFSSDWSFLVYSNGNTVLGDNSGNPPPERLTVNGSVQINTSNRLAFGPVGDQSASAENTDAVYFQRANTGTDSTELRLIIGDNNSTTGTDSLRICTTSATGTLFERYRFQSDGQAQKPGGGSWAVLSDPRAKHDIAPLAGTLDKLLSLRGYFFLYNDDRIATGIALPGTQIGLMADEVARVFPDWVSTDATGTRFVTERATTALMVEALRDLRAEKDAVAAKADAAQREVEALKAEMAQLRSLVERLSRQRDPQPTN